MARRVEQERGASLSTGLERFTGFTLAEDYHQKYRLRSDPQVLAELEELYPTTETFLGSAAVTRANAFLAGHGDASVVEEDLPRMGLSEEARERVRGRVLR